MTYSLPFGLKQKPLNKYLEHGIIKFAVREGKLLFTVKQITKINSSTVLKGEVKSKAHLDKILALKSITEIHALEVVSQ